jgi:hypothetical protein
MCVIITEAAEDDDGRNNPVINFHKATIQGIPTRKKGRKYMSQQESGR